MENTKKYLKLVSFCILICALLAIVKTIISCFVGITVPNDLPEGVTPEFFKTFVNILNIGAIVFVLPDIYIGYKGYKIANGQPSSKAPIVWATIFFVISAGTLISGISPLLSGKDLFSNILAMLISVCDVCLYFLYIKYAKQLRNANNA